MNLLLWIGNEPNQKALANKLAKEFNVVGIVTESRPFKRKITFKKIFNSLYEKIFLPEINKSWWGMKNYYELEYSNYPNVKHIDVENINSEEAYNFSKNLNPDLIIVSGTRLVKKKMLSINSEKGILNLHTGLSPYIKGGPNCTNWCIATKQFHLVGNTIMWIDEGIDSGNIVTTEFTEVNWGKSLLDVHIKVMEHAHQLYVKSIKYIEQGNNSNIKQSNISIGKTYYSKEWKLKNKINLIRNFREAQKNKIEKLNFKNIKTIEITLGNNVYKK
jgi:methionyl-tRNA formyltransferase